MRENAEYHAAKEEQGFAEGRIAAIAQCLGNADLIDIGSLNAGGRVVFGATVELYDVGKETEVKYQIVGEMEANIDSGLVSITSPIARALIGKSEGDQGWMSLSGILNSHLIMAYMVAVNGTPEQKQRFLPLMASGEKRGGICITEPDAGSDVQAIQTRAVRHGDQYVINGTKTLITNGRHGNTFALVTKTDPAAQPAHRGISVFIAEKGPGFTVARDIPKLGYKGVDTCELVFDNYQVPVSNLIGGEEGKGFYHLMSGLEVGRINVAARSVGVARAALEAATKYAKQRETFG